MKSKRQKLTLLRYCAAVVMGCSACIALVHAVEQTESHSSSSTQQPTQHRPGAALENAQDTCESQSINCPALSEYCISIQGRRQLFTDFRSGQTQCAQAQQECMRGEPPNAGADARVGVCASEAEECLNKVKENLENESKNFSEKIESCSEDIKDCEGAEDICEQIANAAKQTSKEEAGFWEKTFDSLVSDPLGAASKAFSTMTDYINAVNLLKQCKSEYKRDDPSCNQTVNAYCNEGTAEEPKWVQKPIKAKHFDKSGCRIDNPVKEETEEGPQVAGMGGEKGEGPLEKKKTEEEKKEGFAGTDTEQDPRTGERMRRTPSSLGGGYGGRQGFQPGGLTDEGRYPGRTSSDQRSSSDQDVRFGGSGSYQSMSRDEGAQYGADTGRLSKHEAPKKPTPKKTIAPPPPDPSLFERVESKYTTLRPQYIYR